VYKVKLKTKSPTGQFIEKENNSKDKNNIVE
jgi:hypothetical protein